MAPDRDGARMTAWGRLPPVRSGVSERPESAQSRQGEPSIRTSASSLIAVTDRIAQGAAPPVGDILWPDFRQRVHWTRWGETPMSVEAVRAFPQANARNFEIIETNDTLRP